MWRPFPFLGGVLRPSSGCATGRSGGKGCSRALCSCSLCPVAAAPAGEPPCHLAPDGHPCPGPGCQAAPAAHPAGVGQRRDAGKARVPEAETAGTALPVPAPPAGYNPLACSCPRAGQGHSPCRGQGSCHTQALQGHVPVLCPPQSASLVQCQPAHVCWLTAFHPRGPSS